MHFRFLLFSFSFVLVFSSAIHAQEPPLPQKQGNAANKDRPVKDRAVRKVSPDSKESPTVITADSVEARQGQILEATGNAVLRQDDQMIRADHLLFLQQSNELFADGSVRLEKSDTAVSGPSLKLDLNKNTGEMEQPSFVLSESNVRGSAQALHIEGKQLFTFDKASYTSCPAGSDDWLLKMSELELDRTTQIGTAYNARIEFMGVPILYTPWMNFPLDDRRRSGLLAPVLGSTNKGGREITIPFYLNIAPNYDATFSPRSIEKRGTLYDNEFRYMGSSYQGKIDYGELREDKIANLDRSHATLQHAQNFGGGFAGSLNFNEASDDAYFRDLSSTPAIATQKHLLREAALTYSGGWWTASARRQSFQTLQDPAAVVEQPYFRFPQVNLGAQRVVGGAIATLSAEYVEFVHPTKVSGRRVVFYPNVSYPLVNNPAYYVTPRLGVHSTQYALIENLDARTPNYDPSYERAVPIYSLDSGMTLERDFTAYEREYVQTLEPRIYYVKIPYRDQDALPNFDTAPSAFSFMQMFTENRFLGSDRIGDADQVTMALTSRLLESDTGNERLRVAIGQRFSREEPRVIIGTPIATTNQSDVLMSVGGRLTDSITLDSQAQYNPNDSRTEIFSASARYRPEAGKVFNLGYRFTFNPDPAKTLKQLDLSTQWLLGGRWHMVAQTKYSLQDSRTVEALAGLEYNQDCWGVRLVAQEFVTATRERSTTIFMQLELKEMIRLGTDPLAALKQSVPGYTVLSDRRPAKPAQNMP